MSEAAQRTALHERREKDFLSRQAQWSGRSRALSAARLVVFIGILASAAMVLLRASEGLTGWMAVLGVGLVVFFALALIHDRVIGHERRYGELAEIERHARARRARDWNALPPPPPVPADLAKTPLARDLHLFGRASLLHLLEESATPSGRRTLIGWLLAGAEPEEIVARQRAVAELAPRLDFRHELARLSAHLPRTGAEVEPFLEWAEGEPWLLRRPGRRWLSILLPLLLLASCVAWYLGVVPGSVPFLIVLANIALTYLLGKEMYEIFDRVSLREGKFHHYAELFAHLHPDTTRPDLEPARFDSPGLEDLGSRLEHEGRPAGQWIEDLHQRVVLSDSRHSAPLNFILQSTTLWDFHVLARLERWQVRAGGQVREWMETLGRVEALSALAGMAWAEPDWTFPEIMGPRAKFGAGADARFDALGLGHPLLAPDVRVTNDVTLGPPGTFLLVTGSNMSGKSTLLRSVGVNAVLAGAGGPVCADRLRLPPLTLGTSILIEDSLESGVSFFLAEILRLQEIVETARRARSEGRTLLYLLDEVLRGTNSRERRLAAREILRHLLELGAVGAVSTHDPALLDSPELAERGRAVHFTETLHPGDEDKVMTFDYTLREGVATGGNAMKLLELVGLTGKGARSAGEEMAPGEGFEPPTNRLTADRSTTELPRNETTESRPD